MTVVNWWQRLFHEPRDVEVAEIKDTLKTETARHNRAMAVVQDALTNLGAAYDLAEKERRARGGA